MLLQLLINGLQVGAIYALSAAGFALIFGSTRIFHVAHGATFTLTAYVFYACLTAKGGHWALAVLAALLASLSFGLLLERLIYAPIRRNGGSLFTMFVASFGAAVVVQNVVGVVFGRSFVSLSTPLTRAIDVGGGLFVSPLAGIALGAALLCFGLLQVLLRHTGAGLGLRALSENQALVQAYGLSPERLSTLAFAVGSVLAVPAAVLTTASPGIHPSIGNHVMLISMAATIVGGIGSTYGAACAGLLLGVVESLSLSVFEPQWSEGVTFVVMFLFILLRPAGLFGRQVST